MTQTVTIDTTTYSATDADANITLTDDAFGVVEAIKELTKAIRDLTGRIN